MHKQNSYLDLMAQVLTISHISIIVEDSGAEEERRPLVSLLWDFSIQTARVLVKSPGSRHRE